ncbi:3-mercaptopyruvate sulfurtransferase [Salmonella enterica subsp. enterica]|uniref:3-mercaptopyruvate sulfurtransferase n=1 Tax=Salmonella enterica I TaxID=59201 RepID=A0A379WPI5_SALET|nr:3-mercaptopyruvate sulfurtransferase [Salmonella enterica subsp. enterica]
MKEASLRRNSRASRGCASPTYCWQAMKKPRKSLTRGPAARFNAQADEPRPGLRRGHIPGALNVPWTELVYEGELKTTDELNEVFFSHGVSFDRPIIASCGSGVTGRGRGAGARHAGCA